MRAGARTALELVRRVTVHLVRKGAETPQWDALIRQHHDLGLASLVGETLRYVASGDGQ